MCAERVQQDAGRLLLACARTPWSSVATLAAVLGLSEVCAGDLCRDLLARGWLQQADFALCHFPRAVFAPTDAGLAACGIGPKTARLKLGLTAERFWALRAAFETAAESNAMCAASVTDWPSGGEWQTFVQRRYRKRPLFLHARLALWDGSDAIRDEARVFYLLNDRGEMPALRWTGYVRYLAQWARRSEGWFPPLLIISTRRFRAWAILALVRMVTGETPGGDGSRGGLIALATAERATVIRRGVAAVAAKGGWLALAASNSLISVNPLALPGCRRDILERSPHAIAGLPDVPKRAAGVTATLPARPPQTEGLERLEALDDNAWRVFSVVCRAPLCPTGFVAAMLGADEGPTANALETLRARGLIAPAEILTRRPMPTLWVATDDALRLRALRDVRHPEDAETRRYRFFAADHARRPGHTLAAYRLAARLARDCAARARATRPMDNGAPYYEWGGFEAEARAAQVYAVDGVGRIFRPDGYGALRAGTAWTRFFIEIDGWLGEDGAAGQRSRADAGVWQGKFGRLCDYYRSLWWTFRYPRFPRVLIVTTDLRNLTLAHDALIVAARARRMDVPQVYMADAREVAEVGPLNRIWYSVNAGPFNQDRCFAFEGAEQPGIVSGERAVRRADLIADMQRAAEIGILALPQPIRRSGASSVGRRWAR